MGALYSSPKVIAISQPIACTLISHDSSELTRVKDNLGFLCDMLNKSLHHFKLLLMLHHKAAETLRKTPSALSIVLQVLMIILSFQHKSE